MNPWALGLVIAAALFWGLGQRGHPMAGPGRARGRLSSGAGDVPGAAHPQFSVRMAGAEAGEHLTHLSGLGLFAVVEYVTPGPCRLGCWAWLLRRYSAPQIAPFPLLVPVVALVLSVVWFGEDVTPRLALASALLLGGVGLTVRAGCWRGGADAGLCGGRE